jgi:hypothetical protein
MSEAVSFNQPRDFSRLEDDAEISVRQGGLLGFVSPDEFAARVAGGTVKTGSGSYTTGAGSVTFAEAYESAPVVIIVASGGNAHILATNSVTTTGFDVVATDNAGANATGTFDWIAIG